MEKWMLCFALPLLLIECFGSEVTPKKTLGGPLGVNETIAKVTLVKIIGRKPDTTQICTNDTLNFVILITCEIRTESGEDCHLGYRYELGFENNCGSKFRLMPGNGAVFLHLTSLTPEDSGNYFCECTRPDGTFSIHFKVTVEGDSRSKPDNHPEKIPLFPLLSPAIIIIITGLILLVVCRRMRNRKPPEPLCSSPSNTEPDDIEPYSTFIQRESGLYSTVRVNGSNTNSNNSQVLN